MKLLYVEMENILSIEKIRLDFEDSGLVLMDGWNYDDDSANGAGKTAAFTGIPLALWDKVPRKITKSEILRKGAKRGYSKVGVDIDGDLYEVIRRRPSKVQFYKNGVEIEMTQEEWEKKIGLSYSQYLICMYSAQAEGKKLLALNDTDKKDFILRLMDLEKFGMKKKEVDAILKDLYEDRTDKDTKIAQIDSKLEVYNEQIDECTILDYSNLEKKLAQYKSVSKPDVSKFIELKKKITNKQDLLSNKYQEQLMVKSKLDVAKQELSNLDNDKLECPECSAEIASGMLLDDRRAQLKSRIADLVSKHNSYPNFRSSRDELNKILEKASIAQKKKEEEFNTSRQKIVELQSTINVRKEQARKQRDLKEKTASLKLEKKNIVSEYADIQHNIEVWETVSMTLAPTGAPAYVMDAVVDVFNEKISDYVSDIWASASYQIQSFKENRDREIKAKFSDRLIVAGRDRSLGSLSGGEYKCLSLAVDFAIMDVIESMFGIYMSPIVLDEPFEGLDASNRERVITLLERRSQKRQIWVIDHASEAKAMFSKIMRIEKRNGISRLVI